jgi:hypothetical protein
MSLGGPARARSTDCCNAASSGISPTGTSPEPRRGPEEGGTTEHDLQNRTVGIARDKDVDWPNYQRSMFSNHSRRSCNARAFKSCPVLYHFRVFGSAAAARKACTSALGYLWSYVPLINSKWTGWECAIYAIGLNAAMARA